MKKKQLLAFIGSSVLGPMRSGLFIRSVVLLAIPVCFYMACVHFTDQYHVTLVRNVVTGEVWCDMHGGFHLTAPWVQASRIDTRPMRVCITTTARAYNCKLVQFEPAAFRKFVEVQGFRYYWWANRISFNLGYGEEYRGMRDIMRGFAFGAEQYPFVKTVNAY
jgi:hypothetical protein